MISGDVHGPVTDIGNYNTGVIADKVHIGKFHLNKSDKRYRTHEEIEQVRSTRDPIRTLRRYAEDWDIATEQEPKQIDKDASEEVDAAVSEAKESPDPEVVDLWADIYSKGSEPMFMRGCERTEVSHFAVLMTAFKVHHYD